MSKAHIVKYIEPAAGFSDSRISLIQHGGLCLMFCATETYEHGRHWGALFVLTSELFNRLLTAQTHKEYSLIWRGYAGEDSKRSEFWHLWTTDAECPPELYNIRVNEACALLAAGDIGLLTDIKQSLHTLYKDF